MSETCGVTFKARKLSLASYGVGIYRTFQRHPSVFHDDVNLRLARRGVIFDWLSFTDGPINLHSKDVVAAGGGQNFNIVEDILDTVDLSYGALGGLFDAGFDHLAG